MIVKRDAYGNLHYGAQQVALGDFGIGAELIVGGVGAIVTSISGAYSAGQQTEQMKIQSESIKLQTAADIVRARQLSATEAEAQRGKTRRTLIYMGAGGAVLLLGALIIVGAKRRAA